MRNNFIPKIAHISEMVNPRLVLTLDSIPKLGTPTPPIHIKNKKIKKVSYVNLMRNNFLTQNCLYLRNVKS